MSHLFAPIIQNLQSIIENGGYITLFLFPLLESIPVIGSFIPGHIIIVLSGFLSELKIFNIYIVVPVIIIGTILGDYLGYYLGKKYGYDFLKSFGKFLFIKNEHIDRTKALINRNVGKSIIFGRINFITRPLIPFIVGASDVHIKKFWLYDFIGVSIWTFASIFVGYIFGASYYFIADIFGEFVLIATIIAIFIVLAYHFINKRFHIFAKYELIVLSFNLLGLYGFFKTIQDALQYHSFMAGLDIWINMFFYSNANIYWLSFMTIFTDIFSPMVLSIITLIGIIYFLIKKKWLYAVIAFLSMYGGLIINALLKEAIMRPRPEYAFILENDFSFPSGHVIAVTIFFTLLIYFFSREIKNIIWREIFISICVFLVILTGISRLYLGVHWLSDTVAGCSLGLFWTTLVILFIRYTSMIINVIKIRKNICIK